MVSNPAAGRAGAPLIGVLGLQGDVEKHLAALQECGAEALSVRSLEALDNVDGLIIPGGESTTIGLLLERFGLMESLRARIASGLPVLGSCAGCILLAREIQGSRQPRIGAMDITVLRNAFGRQVDSFETVLDAGLLGAAPLPAVFIRAPQIVSTGAGVETLVDSEWGPVLARQGNLFAATFHPELTADRRIHNLLVESARG